MRFAERKWRNSKTLFSYNYLIKRASGRWTIINVVISSRLVVAVIKTSIETLNQMKTKDVSGYVSGW